MKSMLTRSSIAIAGCLIILAGGLPAKAALKFSFPLDKKIFPASLCKYSSTSKLDDFGYGSLQHSGWSPYTEYVRCFVVRDNPVLYPIQLFVYVNDKSVAKNFKCLARSATPAGSAHHSITRYSSGTGIQKLTFQGLAVPTNGAITINCSIPSGYSTFGSYGIVEIQSTDQF